MVIDAVLDVGKQMYYILAQCHGSALGRSFIQVIDMKTGRCLLVRQAPMKSIKILRAFQTKKKSLVSGKISPNFNIHNCNSPNSNFGESFDEVFTSPRVSGIDSKKLTIFYILDDSGNLIKYTMNDIEQTNIEYFSPRQQEIIGGTGDQVLSNVAQPSCVLQLKNNPDLTFISDDYYRAVFQKCNANGQKNPKISFFYHEMT